MDQLDQVKILMHLSCQEAASVQIGTLKKAWRTIVQDHLEKLQKKSCSLEAGVVTKNISAST